jgi:hypothetical protein
MNRYQHPFMQMPIILIDPESNNPVNRMADILPEHIQFMHDGLHFGTLIYFIGGAMLMTEATKEAVKHNIGLYWKHVEDYERKQEKAPIFTLQ